MYTVLVNTLVTFTTTYSPVNATSSIFLPLVLRNY